MGLCSVTNWKIALVLNLEYEPGGRNTEDWSAMREDMLSWPCRCSQVALGRNLRCSIS